MSQWGVEEALFREMVESSVYMTTLLDADGTILYVSQAIENLLGYTVDECVGRNCLDFVHPDSTDLAIRAFTEAATRPGADTDVAGSPIVMAYRHHDGSPVLVEVGSSPQLDHPIVKGVILRSRLVPSHGLLDDYFAKLAAGTPLDQTFSPLVCALTLDLPAGIAGIAYDWNGRGFDRGISAGLPDELLGIGEAAPSDPWCEARRLAIPVFHPTIDDMSPAVRAAAEAAGLFACFAYPVVQPGGTIDGCVVVWRSVAGPPWVSHQLTVDHTLRLAAIAFERNRAESRLLHAATHDPLTGVPNRTSFFERLSQVMAQAVERQETAVLYLDLDGFKDVNDRYGHLVGDQLLVETTVRIHRELREEDLVARLGGDEFAVVCPDIAHPGEAESIANRLIDAIREPFKIGDHAVEVGLSVGIAFDHEGRVIDELLDAADTALRSAKVQGKGRCQREIF
jgi:diguanylate cyclase (GGDEF)-like protein/PAS domain S-box-containing protein